MKIIQIGLRLSNLIAVAEQKEKDHREVINIKPRTETHMFWLVSFFFIREKYFKVLSRMFLYDFILFWDEMLYHNEIFVIVFSSKHLIVTYLEITKFKTTTFCYSYTLHCKNWNRMVRISKNVCTDKNAYM